MTIEVNLNYFLSEQYFIVLLNDKENKRKT